MAFMVTGVKDISIGLDWGKFMYPDTTLGHSSTQSSTLIICIGGSMTLGHQHGIRSWPILQTSELPSITTAVMDRYVDHGCSRVMDPNLTLSNRSVDDSMAPRWQSRPPKVMEI